MRTVHFRRIDRGNVLLPLCGDWGSMETDWTEDPDGVTCRACRETFRQGAPGAVAAPALRRG